MRILLLLLLSLFWQPSGSLASEQWNQLADFGSFGRHRGVGIGIGNKAYVGLRQLVDGQ